MQTLYIGNTLINDIFLGSKRMDDALRGQYQTFPIEYLVIAGGGNGGVWNGGGGGAGGLLSGSLTLYANTVYTGSVGGAQTTSSFANLTAIAGGTGLGKADVQVSYSGGSGAGGNSDPGMLAGGLGTIGQGTNGGSGSGADLGAGGGGGGANTAGSNAGTRIGGSGGAGKQSAIDGTLKFYAGGGGGGADNSTNGGGGNGGGGAAGATLGTNGTVNTGGGGGAAGNNGGTGGTGGSGIVVVRYLAPQKASGGVVSVDGNYIIHKFTTTGSLLLATY